MPIAIDPMKTFTVSLASDADAPEKTRPAFAFRYLTGRQWIELSELIDKPTVTRDSATAIMVELSGLVSAVLVDWRNMSHPLTGEPIPYGPDALLDVVNPAELYDLAWELLAHTRPSGADLKKSESPSLSARASCAATAA